MARSRKTKETDVQTNGSHDAQAALAEVPMALPVETPQPPANAQPEKNQPLVSYRLNSDRTTSVGLAVWANTHKDKDGEEYEQLSVTVQRSYKDQQGQWQNQAKPSWRVHDLVALMHLLQKAHSFALNRRTDDSSIPF